MDFNGFFHFMGHISVLLSAIVIMALPLIEAFDKDWRFVLLYLLYPPIFGVLAWITRDESWEDDDEDL